ncbi:septin 4 [Homo sapiens]|uniref:Septin 4 n=1 Tax=Homo sapiens TaxID=9606 RepID=J3KS26_HUMAN|nr:septin 4 [Homo sapiens]KAI4050754.1 septin 4 [Homo sapiens]
MDRSLGWQGNSVPEDRTEAGIKRFLEDTTDDGELSKMTRSMWALQPSPTKSTESP